MKRVFLCLLLIAQFVLRENVQAQIVKTSNDSMLGDCMIRVERSVANWQGIADDHRKKASATPTGFKTGTYWFFYEYTGNKRWLLFTDSLSHMTAGMPLSKPERSERGLPRSVMLTNAYRITRDSFYLKAIIRTVQQISMSFDTAQLRLLSNDGGYETFVSDLPVLELLLISGDRKLQDMALWYAQKIANNHVTSDGVIIPSVRYNAAGNPFSEKSRSVTSTEESEMIYGLAMIYRYSGRPLFLETAQQLTDAWIRKLKGHPIQPMATPLKTDAVLSYDLRGTAVMVSALLELSGQVPDQNRARIYKAQARKLLQGLKPYVLKNGHKDFILDDADDAADYYYLEALFRLMRMENGKPANQPW